MELWIHENPINMPSPYEKKNTSPRYTILLLILCVPIKELQGFYGHLFDGIQKSSYMWKLDSEGFKLDIEKTKIAKVGNLRKPRKVNKKSSLIDFYLNSKFFK